MRRLERFAIIVSILGGFFVGSTYGQQDQYIDADGVYVDAPAGAESGPNRQVPAEPRIPATDYNEQFSSGIINYGFSDPVYHQFSNDAIFEDGNSPTARLTNLAWNHMVPLNLEYVPGFAYGPEFLFFNTKSKDVYAKEDQVIGPEIDMSLYNLSFNVKAYFMNPFEEFLNPYFGIGWGLIFGDFKTTKVDGAQSNTSFLGLSVSRSLGVQVRLGERGGLLMEFRTQTANNVQTDNDPFDIRAGDSISLNMDGIMIGLSGFYRF